MPIAIPVSSLWQGGLDRKLSRDLADGVSVDGAEIASFHDAVGLRFLLNLIQNFAGLLIVFRSVSRSAGEFKITRQQVMAFGEQSPQAELLASV